MFLCSKIIICLDNDHRQTTWRLSFVWTMTINRQHEDFICLDNDHQQTTWRLSFVWTMTINRQHEDYRLSGQWPSTDNMKIIICLDNDHQQTWASVWKIKYWPFFQLEFCTYLKWRRLGYKLKHNCSHQIVNLHSKPLRSAQIVLNSARNWEICNTMCHIVGVNIGLAQSGWLPASLVSYGQYNIHTVNRWEHPMQLATDGYALVTMGQ